MLRGFRERALTSLVTFALLVCFLPGAVTAITLDEAYREALHENKQIKASQERENQAREAVVVAKSWLYPDLTVSGEKVRQKELSQSTGLQTQTFQQQENHQYQFELRHRLYKGGKTRYGWSLRELQAEEESYRHYRRRQEILFEVAKRYYEVLLARRNHEIARNSLKRSQNQLERAEGRFEVGEVTRTSVLRSEVSVSRSEQDLRNAENELDVAHQRLGLAMGYDTAPESVEPINFRTFEDSGIETYYQKAITHRKDLRQIRMARRAAGERVNWEKADQFPSINLVSQYSESDKPRFSSETENWNIQLLGSYPLFTGWQESAEIDQSKAQYREVKAQYERLTKEIKVNIRNVYLDLKSRQKVIETARDEVDSARQNYEQMTAEFEEGLASSVDVNDSLQALEEAESRLANARYNFQLNLLRLRLATGVFKNDLLKETSSGT